MKIKKYSSEQFAGTRNQKIQFEDGMNVIFGKNEAGKSTLLAAIFHALLTSSKLDGRKNREFIDQFFPTSGAKTIDATVTIECENVDDHRERESANKEVRNTKKGEESGRKELGNAQKGEDRADKKARNTQKGEDSGDKETRNSQKGEESGDREVRNTQNGAGSANEEDGNVRKNEKREGKTYIVEKIWDIDGKENFTKVKEEGGDIFRGIQAEEKLSSLLKYGAIFYKNLVFDNQKYEEEMLRWFYEFFSSEGKGNADIMEIKMKLAEAFSVAGGISEEKFLSILEEKMKILSGKWDFKKDAPEKGRGIDNKWKRECGEILLSYYAYQEAKRKWEESVKAEEELEKKTKELKIITQEKSQVKEERARLESQRAEIFNKSKTEKLWKNIKSELKECQETMREWPKKEEEIKIGKEYKRRWQSIELEQEMQGKEEKIEAIKILSEKKKELAKKQREYEELSKDLEKAKEAEKKIQKNQLQLSSVKLSTKICLEEEMDFKVEDANGERHFFGRDFLSSGEMDVDGFFQISIPGKAKIQISPKNLDVEKCQQEIKKNEDILNESLKKYRAETASELSEKKQSLQEKLAERKSIERELDKLLEKKTLDKLEEELAVLEKEWNCLFSCGQAKKEGNNQDSDLKKEASEKKENGDSDSKEEYCKNGEWERKGDCKNSNLDWKEERKNARKEKERLEKERRILKEEIDAFLEKTKKRTLDASIATAETLLCQYENTYKTYEFLVEKRERLEKEEREYEEQLKNLENISTTEEQYKQKMERFEKRLKQIDQERDELSGQIGSLSMREDVDIVETEQEVYRLEEEWKRKKKRYEYYKRIKEDFISLKRESKDKFEKFYKSFCENLAIITGNKIEVTSFQNLELWSEKNRITRREILSKGTKITVLLAFRLAILRCFHYNGGCGVVLLDDVLLDMDQERRENSAMLLRAFAKENQVIFTTCDEQIASLLGGNFIQI